MAIIKNEKVSVGTIASCVRIFQGTRLNVQQHATNCSGVRKPPIVVASLQNLSIDGSGLSWGLAKSVALHHCPSAGTIKDKLVDLRRALRVIMVDLQLVLFLDL